MIEGNRKSPKLFNELFLPRGVWRVNGRRPCTAILVHAQVVLAVHDKALRLARFLERLNKLRPRHLRSPRHRVVLVLEHGDEDMIDHRSMTLTSCTGHEVNSSCTREPVHTGSKTFPRGFSATIRANSRSSLAWSTARARLRCSASVDLPTILAATSPSNSNHR